MGIEVDDTCRSCFVLNGVGSWWFPGLPQKDSSLAVGMTGVWVMGLYQIVLREDEGLGGKALIPDPSPSRLAEEGDGWKIALRFEFTLVRCS